VKRILFAALALASTLTASPAVAQLAPYNAAGLTMGHWHIATKNVEAEKQLFLAMGGKLYNPGGQPLIAFPGVYISLILAGETGEGGTVGSVVNHVGFVVDNVQKRVAEWKAAGVKVLPGGALPAGGNRLDQAYVETPDGVRMEILEDKTQTVPIRNEHIHLALPAAEVPKAVAWYARVFGGQAATRNNAPVVNLPGVQLRFNTADTPQAPTRHRVLDHIGFDVNDHAAFVKRLEGPDQLLSPKTVLREDAQHLLRHQSSPSLIGQPPERGEPWQGNRRKPLFPASLGSLRSARCRILDHIRSICGQDAKAFWRCFGKRLKSLRRVAGGRSTLLYSHADAGHMDAPGFAVFGFGLNGSVPRKVDGMANQKVTNGPDEEYPAWRGVGSSSVA